MRQGYSKQSYVNLVLYFLISFIQDLVTLFNKQIQNSD